MRSLQSGSAIPRDINKGCRQGKIEDLGHLFLIKCVILKNDLETEKPTT